MAQSLTHGETALPADWRDLFALTKPRVMSLVVFTALCGLLAAPGSVPPVLAFSSILAIALGAGASGALNQWYEAGLDAKMKRTAGRPLPAGRLAVFLDLHNPASRDLRPFFFVGPPELLSETARTNRERFLNLAVEHLTGPLTLEPKPRVTGANYHPLWRRISGQWVNDHGNEHTLAACLETSWNTRHSTTDGYRTVGRQLGEALAEYLSSPAP